MKRARKISRCDGSRDADMRARQFEAKRKFLLAAGNYRYSWMSNTKWRKVFTAIAKAGTNVKQCEYKTIDMPGVAEVRTPQLRDLREREFEDGAYQPFAYKWIEWFRFPRRYQPYKRRGVGYVIEQDVEALKTVIEKAAHARLELDDNYLWLYGYSDPITVQFPIVEQ